MPRAARRRAGRHRDRRGNDLLALGCYDVLAERGLRCPDDVSVVGFNDMPFADRFDPPLTTVRIPHREIGAAAADLLLERLGDAEGAGTPGRARARRSSPAGRPRAAAR